MAEESIKLTVSAQQAIATLRELASAWRLNRTAAEGFMDETGKLHAREARHNAILKQKALAIKEVTKSLLAESSAAKELAKQQAALERREKFEARRGFQTRAQLKRALTPSGDLSNRFGAADQAKIDSTIKQILRLQKEVDLSTAKIVGMFNTLRAGDRLEVLPGQGQLVTEMQKIVDLESKRQRELRASGEAYREQAEAQERQRRALSDALRLSKEIGDANPAASQRSRQVFDGAREALVEMVAQGKITYEQMAQLQAEFASGTNRVWEGIELTVRRKLRSLTNATRRIRDEISKSNDAIFNIGGTKGVKDPMLALRQAAANLRVDWERVEDLLNRYRIGLDSAVNKVEKGLEPAIRRVVAEEHKLERQADRLAAGIERQTLKMWEQVQAIAAQKREQEHIANIERRRQQLAAGFLSRMQLPADLKNSASQEEFDRYSDAAAGLARMLQQGQISYRQLVQLESEYNNRVVRDWDAAEKKARSYIAKLLEAYNNLGAAQRKQNQLLEEARRKEELAVNLTRRRQQLADGFAKRHELSPEVKSVSTTDEINAHRRAVANLTDLLLTGRLTYAQLRRLEKEYHDGTIRGFSAAEKAALDYFSKLQKAEAQLGATRRKELDASQARLRAFARSGVRELKEVERANQSILLSWRSMGRLFVIQALYSSFARLQSAMEESLRTSVDFSIKIAEIRTLSQRSALSFKDWERSIIDLSNAFGNPVLDTAAATYEAVSNQIGEGADALLFMRDALELATVGVSSAQSASDLLAAAINSFGLEANQARDLAASFFKTVDLGRVTIDELASTFGRVGPLASSLGVGINELNAMIATLTVSGLKFNEAFTLINNIFNGLLKPTDELESLFSDWGVASGEAAIATFGLQGVFKRLMDEFERGGSTRVAQLFENIRGLRGVVGIIRNLDGYADALQEITFATAEYAAASKEAFQSTGKQLEIELNRFQNAILTQFAQPATKAFLDLVKAGGGLVNIMGTALRLAIGLGAAFAGWRIASSSMSVLSGVFNNLNRQQATFSRLLGRNIGLIENMGLRARITGRQLARSLFQPNVLVAAAAALISYHLAQRAAIRATAESALETLTAAAEKIRNEEAKTTKAVLSEYDKRRAAAEKAIRQQFQLTLQFIADLRKLTTEIAKAHEKILAKQLEVVDKFVDKVRGQMDDLIANLRSDIAKIDSEIERSLNLLDKYNRDVESSEFERDFNALEDSDTAGKDKLIDDRINQLRTELATIHPENDSLEAEIKAAEQRRDLEAEIAQLIQRRIALFEADAKMGDESASAKIAEYEKQARDFAKERHQAEEAFRDRLKKRQEEEKARLEKTEKNRERLADLTSGLNKLDGGEGAKEELAELDKIIQTIKDEKLLDDSGISNDAKLQLDRELKALRNKLEQDIKLQELQAQAAEQQQKLATAQEQQLKNTEALSAAQNDLKAAAAETAKILPEVSQALAQIAAQLSEGWGGSAFDERTLLPVNNLPKIPGVNPVMGGNYIQRDELDRLVTDLRRNAAKVDAIISDGNLPDPKLMDELAQNWQHIEAIAAAMDRANVATARFTDQSLSPFDKPRLPVAPSVRTGETSTSSDGVNTLKDDLAAVSKILDRAAKAQQQNADVRKRLEDLNAKLQKDLEEQKNQIAELRKQYEALPKDTTDENVRQELINQIEAMSKAAQGLTDKIQLNTLEQQLQDLERKRANLGGNDEEAAEKLDKAIAELAKQIEALKNKIPGMAHGGWVTGGRPGKDSVLRMLMPGEFVVPAEAARNHRSMLEAMAFGDNMLGSYFPQQLRRSPAGSHSTVVGNINISVTGGDTSEVTVRRIGMELQRQIRRGTIQLTPRNA